MKIVVKIGTQALLAGDGTLAQDVLKSLTQQLVDLKNLGHQVLLVTSGAVASGRFVARQVLKQEFGSSMTEKQLLASLGQPVLLQTYATLFKPFGIAAAQVLLTKQDFRTEQHTLNIERLVKRLLKTPQIIPIINENDSVATEELMFTDNDELAGLLAKQLPAKKLIILSNIAGVFDGPPENPASQVISLLSSKREIWRGGVSSSGRGGMQSKLKTAKKMASLGISTHIASAHEPNILPRILAGEKIGTTLC